MKLNMLWDGLHAATWLMTMIGVWMWWADRPETAADARRLSGQMLLGWGVFNLIEGVVDHHLLQLHHVRDIPIHVPAYDWAFLVFGGVVFILAGWVRASPAHHRVAW